MENYDEVQMQRVMNLPDLSPEIKEWVRARVDAGEGVRKGEPLSFFMFRSIPADDRLAYYIAREYRRM